MSVKEKNDKSLVSQVEYFYGLSEGNLKEEDASTIMKMIRVNGSNVEEKSIIQVMKRKGWLQQLQEGPEISVDDEHMIPISIEPLIGGLIEKRWKCQICDSINNTKYCVGCSYPSPYTSIQESETRNKDLWVCPTCGRANETSLDECPKCRGRVHQARDIGYEISHNRPVSEVSWNKGGNSLDMKTAKYIINRIGHDKSTEDAALRFVVRVRRLRRWFNTGDNPELRKALNSLTQRLETLGMYCRGTATSDSNLRIGNTSAIILRLEHKRMLNKIGALAYGLQLFPQKLSNVALYLSCFLQMPDEELKKFMKPKCPNCQTKCPDCTPKHDIKGLDAGPLPKHCETCNDKGYVEDPVKIQGCKKCGGKGFLERFTYDNRLTNEFLNLDILKIKDMIEETKALIA